MPRGLLEAACRGDEDSSHTSPYAPPFTSRRIGRPLAPLHGPSASPLSCRAAAAAVGGPLSGRLPASSFFGDFIGGQPLDDDPNIGLPELSAARRLVEMAPQADPGAAYYEPLGGGPQGFLQEPQESGGGMQVGQPVPIVEAPMAKMGQPSAAPIQQDAEVIEYWAVEGPDGRIRRGHKVHHIHNGKVVDEEVREARHHYRHHRGAAGGVVGRHHRHQVPDQEPAVGAPATPGTAEPSQGYAAQSEAAEAQAQLESQKEDQSGVTPSVLFGGALAIFAQIYLWGSVFVTLFKQPPRQPAAAAAVADQPADRAEGAQPPPGEVPGGASPAAAASSAAAAPPPPRPPIVPLGTLPGAVFGGGGRRLADGAPDPASAPVAVA